MERDAVPADEPVPQHARLRPELRAREPLNRWILAESAKAAAEVTAALGAYRFNDAAGAVYRFIWDVFCDWYIELAKPVLQGAVSPKRRTKPGRSRPWCSTTS